MQFLSLYFHGYNYAMSIFHSSVESSQTVMLNTAATLAMQI